MISFKVYWKRKPTQKWCVSTDWFTGYQVIEADFCLRHTHTPDTVQTLDDVYKCINNICNYTYACDSISEVLNQGCLWKVFVELFLLKLFYDDKQEKNMHKLLFSFIEEIIQLTCLLKIFIQNSVLIVSGQGFIRM